MATIQMGKKPVGFSGKKVGSGMGSSSGKGKMSRKKRNQLLKSSIISAGKLQEESDKLNNWKNLTKETIFGLPGATRKVASTMVRHPIETSKAIGSNLADSATRTADSLISYLPGKQPIIPKIGYKSKNDVVNSIGQGFGFAGDTAPYMYGPAALRALTKGPKTIAAIGKFAPWALKAADTAGKTKMVRPFVNEFVADQIMTQLLAGGEASGKQRAFDAATTGAGSLIVRGIGGGFRKATAPFKAKAPAAAVPKKGAGVRFEGGIEPGTGPTKVRPMLMLDEPKGTVRGKGFVMRPSNYDQPYIAPSNKPSTKYKPKGDPNSPFYNPETGYLDEDKFIQDAMERARTEGIEKPGFFKKMFNKAFDSGERQAQRQGPAGKAVAQMVNEQQFQESQVYAKYLPTLRNSMKGMSKADRLELDVAVRTDGGKKLLKTDQQKMAYDIWDNIRKDVDVKLRKNKVKLRNDAGERLEYASDPDKVGRYAPEYVDDATKNSPDFRKSMIDDLILKGDDPTTAALKADRSLAEQPIRRAGSLEYVREAHNPNYIKDPNIWMPRYLKQVARRIPEIEIFGQEHQRIKPLLGQIDAMGGNSSKVREVLDAMYGSRIDNKFVSTAMKWNLFTKLSLSAFQNLTQFTNFATQGGLRNSGRVIKDWFLHPNKHAAMKDLANLGDAWDEMLMSTEAGVGDNKAIQTALWLFKKSEGLLRGTAANVGAESAKSNLKALRKNADNEVAKRALKALGINVDEAIKRGTLTQESLARAAYNMVDQTQFHINPMKLPTWSRSTWGKFFTQFKSFGYMQTKFYRDHIINEARQGNYMPLLRMMVTAPPAFYFAAQVRNFVGQKPDRELSEKEKDSEFLQFLLKMTGTLPASMTQDFIYGYNKMNSENASPISKATTLMGNTFGPTVSDIGRVISGMEQSGDLIDDNRRAVHPSDMVDTLYPQKKFLVNQIPYIGPGLKNTYFNEWPKGESERMRDEMMPIITKAIREKDLETIRELFSVMNNQHELTSLQRMVSDAVKEVSLENLPPQEQERYKSIEERKQELKFKPIR